MRLFIFGISCKTLIIGLYLRYEIHSMLYIRISRGLGFRGRAVEVFVLLARAPRPCGLDTSCTDTQLRGAHPQMSKCLLNSS